MITTYIIKRLDCHSCVMMIESICEDTEGVTKAEVNPGKKLLTVEHQPHILPEHLQSALESEGYPVELLEQTE